MRVVRGLMTRRLPPMVFVAALSLAAGTLADATAIPSRLTLVDGKTGYSVALNPG